MKGTAAHEDSLAQADPGAHRAYLSLRDRDERCNWCRMADVCPSAWMGSLDCPDLDHLLKGEDK